MSLKTGSTVILIFTVNHPSLITFLMSENLVACPFVAFMSTIPFFLLSGHLFYEPENVFAH